MKVRALKNFSLGGGVDVLAGQEFELADSPETQARLRSGKVEPLPDEPMMESTEAAAPADRELARRGRRGE